MEFTSAFNKGAVASMDFQLGENNHDELTIKGLGDNLLVLFDSLVRGFDENEMRSLITKILNEGDKEQTKNLFVLAFQTRWCRGGKGEKLIFYKMLKIFYETHARAVVSLLEFVPEFGYWKDLLLLLQEIKTSPTPRIDYKPLNKKVWSMFASQLKLDFESFEKDKSKQVSLCSKFAPTQNHKFDKELNAVSEICKCLFEE